MASNSTESNTSYRNIFKATSLFGGVQGLTILIQVVKSKIIAILLGPMGVGIQGLYQSALDLIRQTTSLGISQSAVRDVAEASGTGDYHRISRTVTILRKVVWWTGGLGLLTVLLFSPVLSKVSFGNYEHVFAFAILSVVMLLEQLSAGQKVVLQGTRRLKELAKATAWGALVGLVISTPIFYFFRLKGIVPAIVLTSVIALFISWTYSKKITIEKVKVGWKDVVEDGRSMMVMGLSMSATGILSMGAAFIIRSCMRQWGGTEEVGLFQAGFVIINSYVGLVFNAIATDYYPRLAAINHDNEKIRDVVSRQGEVAVLLLSPLLTICILAMPLVIRILYSEEFLPANDFIMWACLGMMFRLSSWLVAYLFVAKAEAKLFVINELVGNTYNLIFCLLGYKMWGVTGVGIAFALNYVIYSVQVYLIARHRYSFGFSKEFTSLFTIQLILVASILACVNILSGPTMLISGTLLIAISLTISVIGLNNRLQLKSWMKRMKK